MSAHLLTAADAAASAVRAAGALHRDGVRPGDFVALIGPTPATPAAEAPIVQAALASVALGALRAGIIPVVPNPALTGNELARLVADVPMRREYRDAQIVGLTAAGLRTPVGLELADVPLGRPMHFTSGTSGRSKGVWAGPIDESASAAFWADEALQWRMHDGDTLLTHGSLAHSAPLRFSLLAAMAGAHAVFTGPFDAQRIAHATHAFRPTVAMVVPTHLERLLSVPGGPPTSSYRMLVHAGSSCPAPLKRRVHEWAGASNVWEFLGSTEGQFTACHGPEWEARPGTVGRARPGRTLVIEPVETTSDWGAVWCAAPESAAFEYYADPIKTAAAWRDDSGRREFTVGDLGQLDSDGYLFLGGRRDDLIITGGVNVYPAEVEELLQGCPAVEQAAVFGVDDAQWGQRVCAAVVLSPAHRIEDARAWARHGLSGYRRPKEWIAVSELPMTPNGKVARSELGTLARA